MKAGHMHDKLIAQILRDAWKVHRLDVIRGVVQRAIDGLCAIEPDQLLGHETLSSEESERGPVRAALEACCAELRDGCGLTDAAPRVALMPPKGALAARWLHTYALALERYRQMARAALESSLRAKPANAAFAAGTAR